MKMTAENFMPILFQVLFGFVTLNIFINFLLLMIKKKRLYKLLAIYWPSVFMVFILQSIYQTGNLAVVLAWSPSAISASIIAILGLEVIGRTFPIKKYAIMFVAALALTLLMHKLDYSFTFMAMPFAIACATPLIHMALYTLIIDRRSTTKLQKLSGIVYFLLAIHAINFALFRMEPGAQLWGWIVTYAIYDMLAIILPSMVLEKASMTENDRLQALVAEKTHDLNKAMKENESLIKVLLHDISNPLTVMRWYLQIFKPKTEDDQRIIDKVKKSQNVIDSIVGKVKDLHGKKGLKPKLDPIILEDCLNDVNFIFAQSLEKKKISLKFHNHLSPETKILADRTSFTHSVLSNLVSNGLKFSEPNSEIEIIAKEDHDNVILEVRDHGPGMPRQVIDSIYNEENAFNSEGTQGEKGSGFGLSIVKSFVDSYGGHIEFDSRPHLQYPQDHGTNIKITLNKA